VRFFPRRNPDEVPRVVALVAFLGLVPVFALWLDWRLGLVITAAYVVLGVGVWRVSKRP